MPGEKDKKDTSVKSETRKGANERVQDACVMKNLVVCSRQNTTAPCRDHQSAHTHKRLFTHTSSFKHSQRTLPRLTSSLSFCQSLMDLCKNAP